MLGITASQSAAAAQSYFANELTQADYYLGQGEKSSVGRWHGRAAALLGLSGEVTREDFNALTENRHPATGERITQRTKQNRRVGYDLTVSAKKSVSILHTYTGDERILEAFEASVSDAMREVEDNMLCRVRKDGQNTNRKTANLVYAGFTHLSSRPVQGVSDPQLHQHCFVMNQTYDPHEGKWKAVELGDVHIDRIYYQQVFESRFAERLENLGYPIERRGKSWEVAGIERSTIEKFSTRTREIEAEAKRLGIQNPGMKALLGARTRKNKADEIGTGYSRQAFLDRLTEAEKKTLDMLAAGQGTKPNVPPTTPSNAVAFALAHSFERQSVAREKRVLAEALRHGIGSHSVDAIKAAYKAHPDVLRETRGTDAVVTTQAVLAEERALIQFARDGKGTCAPLVDNVVFKNPELGEDQRAAARELLASCSRVSVLRGGAGTGKSWLAREVVEQIERNGKSVVMLAPSADASRRVLRDEGFSQAETVSKFMLSPEMQAKAKNNVLWIDEAGLLGNRDMLALFRVAKAQNARIILGGDVRQHKSVARGDALRLLEQKARVPTVSLTKIRRQNTAWYRRVIENIQAGRVRKGFEQLERNGGVTEIVDPSERNAAIAAAYVDARRSGKSVLVVSPSHAEGNAVTEAIRARMQADGLLTGKPRRFQTLESLNLTAAERADSASFEHGQVVSFVRRCRSHRPGERFVVAAPDRHGQIRMVGEDGRRHPIPVHAPQSFEVYRPRERSLMAGDTIRITRGGKTADGRRLDNGGTFAVAGFTRDGEVVLDDKRGTVLGKDFGHWKHGFVTTSNAAQGRSADRVIVAQSMALSAGPSSQNQAYVSLSRGRESAQVFTDDLDTLRKAVCRNSDREAAVELFDRFALREDESILRRIKVRAQTIAAQVRDTTHALVQKYASPRPTPRGRGLEPEL